MLFVVYEGYRCPFHKSFQKRMSCPVMMVFGVLSYVRPSKTTNLVLILWMVMGMVMVMAASTSSEYKVSLQKHAGGRSIRRIYHQVEGQRDKAKTTQYPVLSTSRVLDKPASRMDGDGDGDGRDRD